MRALEPAIWFPTIRAGTGADVYVERLCAGLNARGIRAEISWLPHRAEYLPWSVPALSTPDWATVAHVNTWLHRRFIPTQLPLVTTTHLCVHDPVFSPYKSMAQSMYHRYWIKRVEDHGLQHAQQIVSVSQYTAEQTRQAFGVRDIRLIHNGIPLPEDIEALPARTLHTPFRLLYVGNWSLRKGVDLLAPIMENLGVGYELLYTADAHGAHRKANLPANCRCLGRLDQAQVRGAYRDSDALIFPSRLEGLPLTVIEAMAQGLPVVCANSSSIPEIIENGISGAIVAVDDIGAYSDAIRVLATRPDVATQRSVAGALRVKSHFSEERMIREYLDMYRQTLYQWSRAKLTSESSATS